MIEKKKLDFIKVIDKDIPYLLDLRKRTMNKHLKNMNMPIDEETHLKRVKYHFENGFIVLTPPIVRCYPKYSHTASTLPDHKS